MINTGSITGLGTGLTIAPATELTRALRTREISSRELLAAYLARIEHHNPALNAVVTLDDHAFERAAEADAALARDEIWGPLHGLPITIKDSLETAGLRTTAGAAEWADHIPVRDADAVARLKAAGAIVMGKTNLPRTRPMSRPTTRCSAPRTTHGTRRERSADPPAVRPAGCRPA